MDFFEVIEARRSVRSFRDKPVPRESIERMLAAAGRAPSAMNERPWRFYVTTGDTRLRLGEVIAQSTTYLSEYFETLGPEEYEKAARWYSELGHAPVVIVCTMPIADEELTRLNRHLSIGAAVENMSLTATAEGLGTCIVTSSFWVRDELAELLEVPDDCLIVAIMAVGYAENDQAEPVSSDINIATYLG